MQIVVMGISGSGKTTVGRRLAAELGFDFLDADDVHSPESITAMAHGRPLRDDEREPWLEALRAALEVARARGRNTVLACSALAQRHRDRLGLVPGEDALVYLRATPELVRERLRARTGHFMKESMLESQLATLEPPTDAIEIDAARPLDDEIAAVRRTLNR